MVHILHSLVLLELVWVELIKFDISEYIPRSLIGVQLEKQVKFSTLFSND